MQLRTKKPWNCCLPVDMTALTNRMRTRRRTPADGAVCQRQFAVSGIMRTAVSEATAGLYLPM